jgi:ATP-dependent Zn protease
MAKYTKNDAEIQALNQAEKAEYNLELTKYNVDSNTEAHSSIRSLYMLVNTKNIENIFTNPKQILPAFMSLLIGLILVGLIIFCLILFVLMAIGGSENHPRIIAMKKVLLYVFTMFLLSLFLYSFYNMILGITITTAPLAKE